MGAREGEADSRGKQTPMTRSGSLREIGRDKTGEVWDLTWHWWLDRNLSS